MTEYRKLFALKQKEIEAAFKVAFKHSSIIGLKLLHSPDPNTTHGRLLIVTSRACGKAHERNQIRRRIKSIYYKHKLYNTPGIWILIVYKEAMNLDFEEIESFLQRSMG